MNMYNLWFKKVNQYTNSYVLWCSIYIFLVFKWIVRSWICGKRIMSFCRKIASKSIIKTFETAVLIKRGSKLVCFEFIICSIAKAIWFVIEGVIGWFLKYKIPYKMENLNVSSNNTLLMAQNNWRVFEIFVCTCTCTWVKWFFFISSGHRIHVVLY